MSGYRVVLERGCGAASSRAEPALPASCLLFRTRTQALLLVQGSRPPGPGTERFAQASRRESGEQALVKPGRAGWRWVRKEKQQSIITASPPPENSCWKARLGHWHWLWVLPGHPFTPEPRAWRRGAGHPPETPASAGPPPPGLWPCHFAKENGGSLEDPRVLEALPTYHSSCFESKRTRFWKWTGRSPLKSAAHAGRRRQARCLCRGHRQVLSWVITPLRGLDGWPFNCTGAGRGASPPAVENPRVPFNSPDAGCP